MRASVRDFTSQIELSCTVFCGENGEFKLTGTAVRIEPALVVLRIKKVKQALRLGDQVRLNVHLPAEPGIAAKDLAIRARIIQISDGRQGVRTFVVSFRRAQFKDRDAVQPEQKRAAGANWEM